MEEAILELTLLSSLESKGDWQDSATITLQ